MAVCAGKFTLLAALTVAAFLFHDNTTTTIMNPNGNHAVLTDTDGRKLTVYIATITPDEARQRLTKMAHNRPMKTRKVERIAQAISEGSYMLNGQPLIVDSAQSGLDGQHRLAACAKADKPIRTLVVEGVATEVFPTLDLFERKLSETLVAEYALDIKKAGITASVINLAFTLRTSKNIHGADFPSTWTALEFYNNERKKIDQRVIEAIEKFTTKIIPTAKLVALWHEFSNLDSELARKFFMAMCGLSHELKQFDQLRELFVGDMAKSPKKRVSARIKLAYCIKAFNAVMAGTDVEFKMKRKEGFPIIGPDSTTTAEE